MYNNINNFIMLTQGPILIWHSRHNADTECVKILFMLSSIKADRHKQKEIS